MSATKELTSVALLHRKLDSDTLDQLDALAREGYTLEAEESEFRFYLNGSPVGELLEDHEQVTGATAKLHASVFGEKSGHVEVFYALDVFADKTHNVTFLGSDPSPGHMDDADHTAVIGINEAGERRIVSLHGLGTAEEVLAKYGGDLQIIAPHAFEQVADLPSECAKCSAEREGEIHLPATKSAAAPAASPEAHEANLKQRLVSFCEMSDSVDTFTINTSETGGTYPHPADLVFECLCSPNDSTFYGALAFLNEHLAEARLGRFIVACCVDKERAATLEAFAARDGVRFCVWEEGDPFPFDLSTLKTLTPVLPSQIERAGDLGSDVENGRDNIPKTIPQAEGGIIGRGAYPVEELDLDTVRFDMGTQMRVGGIDEDTVKQYAEDMREGDRFEPGVVIFDGTNHICAAGFHRSAAARRVGRTSFEFEVRPGDLRDAILFAIKSNNRHGLRTKDVDKRRAVQTLLQDEEWSKWSNREIARQCGVSHAYVGSVREELSGSRVQIEAKARRGGTEYIVSTEKIGKSNSPAEAPPEAKDDSHDRPEAPTVSATTETRPSESPAPAGETSLDPSIIADAPAKASTPSASPARTAASVEAAPGEWPDQHLVINLAVKPGKSAKRGLTISGRAGEGMPVFLTEFTLADLFPLPPALAALCDALTPKKATAKAAPAAEVKTGKPSPGKAPARPGTTTKKKPAARAGKATKKPRGGDAKKVAKAARG